jgi:hypothetical protein
VRHASRGQRKYLTVSLSMSADATIRRLRSDDAASFRAIRLEAVKANPEALGSTFELEDKLDVAWFAGRLEDAHVMGAFQDGELVGTAGFSIYLNAQRIKASSLPSNSVRSRSIARCDYFARELQGCCDDQRCGNRRGPPFAKDRRSIP